MSTGGWTRQWIKFNYSTNTFFHKQYEDWSRVITFWIIRFFLPAKGSGLHTNISDQLVQKLNVPHVIRFSSPVTDPNVVLTNINITLTNITVAAVTLFYYYYFHRISSCCQIRSPFLIIILFFSTILCGIQNLVALIEGLLAFLLTLHSFSLDMINYYFNYFLSWSGN